MIAFESVMEFDSWSIAFKRQTQMIQEENAALRSTINLEQSQLLLNNDSSILNESTILAANNIPRNLVNDDDSKSLIQVGNLARKIKRPPRAISNILQNTFLSQQDLQSAKQRLQEL